MYGDLLLLAQIRTKRGMGEAARRDRKEQKQSEILQMKRKWHEMAVENEITWTDEKED